MSVIIELIYSIAISTRFFLYFLNENVCMGGTDIEETKGLLSIYYKICIAFLN